MRRANANGIDIEYDCVGIVPAEPMPMPLGTRDALHLATAAGGAVETLSMERHIGTTEDWSAR
jgi:hypothetical protein